MKNALLVLVSLLITVPASAADPVIECRGRGPGNYIGGVGIRGGSFDRSATFTDNFNSGRGVCEPVRDDSGDLLCVGLWRFEAEPVELHVRGIGTAQITVTFKRSTFYGGDTVELPCEERVEAE